MTMLLANKIKLNGICPYFTMFPLQFPYGILSENAASDDIVLDPFCGRGTTIYAARLLGLPSYAIDSSPVAAAISAAKLVNVSPQAVVDEVTSILASADAPTDVPVGEFWELAFHPQVLRDVCMLREALLSRCDTDVRLALRAIILGALHGPLTKTQPSYFSNQCQRTYAPKPKYAVRFWRRNDLYPKPLNVLPVIEARAHRYFGGEEAIGRGLVIQGDSRTPGTFARIPSNVRWIVTSPPYYGLRTYIPDQWLRAWFLGGRPEVDYTAGNQVTHMSPEAFANDLKLVWTNVGRACADEAHMVIRFGGINDRKADPLEILQASLTDTSWSLESIIPAGSAAEGRRQALHIKNAVKAAREEHDVWLKWMGNQAAGSLSSAKLPPA